MYLVFDMKIIRNKVKKIPRKFPLLSGNQELLWKDELRLDTRWHRYKAFWKVITFFKKERNIRGQLGHCHRWNDRGFIQEPKAWSFIFNQSFYCWKSILFTRLNQVKTQTGVLFNFLGSAKVLGKSQRNIWFRDLTNSWKDFCEVLKYFWLLLLT